jgi:hypothetical protein
MGTLRIYLKSGQVFDMQASEWTTQRDRLDSSLTGFTWTAEGPIRLPYLRLDAVEAIVDLGEVE